MSLRSQECIIVRKNSRGRWQRIKRSHSGNSKPKIWCLPDEIMLQILKGLHIKDLLNMHSAHPDFRDLIDSSSSVWFSISFQDTWPTEANVRHFEKAAAFGNLEALIKLGIAYLYNEGFAGDFEGKRITHNGEKAAEMFCRVESLTPRTVPFTWLFIRPPWALRGACCKECVFNNMKNYVTEHGDSSVEVCIAKTLQLLDIDNAESEMEKYLKDSQSHGSSVAAHMLWEHQYTDKVLDKAGELHSLRALRKVAKLGYLESQLSLCSAYVSQKYGGYTRDQAASYVREFIQSSKPSDVQDIYKNSKNELNHSMRFILMDWLVEVANMKHFNSLTLHVAINVVDRYLKCHVTTRSKLQLLGVSAMVLCSRFLGKDIITIREAAWLTDNTYKYEDVVRMMGEITATLKGNLRVVTTLDYTELLGQAAGNKQVTQTLAEYICEMALLQSEISSYPQAQIAASCVLLARLSIGDQQPLSIEKECPWSSTMSDFSGYTIEDLIPCTFLIHEKSFEQDEMVDHRDIKLQAVKIRYSEPANNVASDITIVPHERLKDLLALKCDRPSATTTPLYPHIVITSPSRSGRAPRPSETKVDREQTATPTLLRFSSLKSPGFPEEADSAEEDLDESVSRLDLSSDSLEEFLPSESEDRLNESMLSGYAADNEEELAVELEGYDSDADLESLWCTVRANGLSEPQSYDENDYSFSDESLVLWSPVNYKKKPLTRRKAHNCDSEKETTTATTVLKQIGSSSNQASASKNAVPASRKISRHQKGVNKLSAGLSLNGACNVFSDIEPASSQGPTSLSSGRNSQKGKVEKRTALQTMDGNIQPHITSAPVKRKSCRNIGNLTKKPHVLQSNY